MTLRQEFQNDFASSAFQSIDGEQNIIGKFGRITQLDDGSYDCWFIGPDLSPLTTHRMAAIRRNAQQEWGLRELTGEAYAQGRGRAFVLQAAALAGVKKKRRVTAAMREHLRKARLEAQAA